MSDASSNAADAAQEETQALRAFSDNASRRPVLLLMVTAVAWLFAASILGFCASMKSHAADLFAGHGTSFLHYGRLKPAFETAFIYGWCVQAGLAVAYWLMARLCKVGFQNRSVMLWGCFLWNVLVTAAVLSILFAGSNSLEWLSFPDWIWVPLLAAYVMMSLGPLVLYQVRRPGTGFVSELYLFGALLWFPILFLGANFIVRHSGDIGVMAPATASWYVNGLLFLFLVPVGVGTSYYVIPKITGRAVHSQSVARLGFWSLVIFAGFSGMQRFLGGPIPKWVTALAAAAGILLLIPILAVAWNQHFSTKGDHGRIKDSPTMRFTIYGGFCLTAFGLCWFLLSMLWTGKVFQFSLAQNGVVMLCAYGFFTMTMFGAFYFILPRLVGCEWPSARFIDLHFWCSNWGVVFLVGLLLLGGYLQGSNAKINRQAAEDEKTITVLVEKEVNGETVKVPEEKKIFDAVPGGYTGWERDYYRPHMMSGWARRGVTFSWFLLAFANLIFFSQVAVMALRLGRKSPKPTLLGHGAEGAH